MIAKEDLILDVEAIFLPPFYYAEIGVASKLKRLLEDSTGNLFDGSLDIEAIVKQTSIQYDDVQVLRDIIDSGVVPVIRLTRIFRQAQSSRIITNAHKINQGIFPDISNGRDADFFFIKQEDPEKAAQEIVNIVKTAYQRHITIAQMTFMCWLRCKEA